MQARVCWARPIGENRWWLGCSFDNPIELDSLTELAADGYIDRRRDQRVPINKPAQVRWELSSDCIDARMLDLSSGGFSLHVPERPRAGDRLLLSFPRDGDDAIPVVARVHWQREAQGGEGYVVGCGFVDKHSFRRVRRRLGIRSSKFGGYELHARSKDYLWPLVLGVAVTAIAAMMLVLGR